MTWLRKRKMGVKFAQIHKKSWKRAQVTLWPQSPYSASFWPKMPELKVVLVLAAFLAFTAATKCQLMMCTDQLGLKAEGNITWQRNMGGGRASKGHNCADEVYVSCNQEVNLNHSTCIFHSKTSGKKLTYNMIVVHSGASAQSWCFVFVSFWKFRDQLGCTIAEVSAKRPVEYARNALLNITTEGCSIVYKRK